MLTEVSPRRAAERPALRSSVNLLIIQPTPFCNINCDYCYLPDRNSTKRISFAVLKQTLKRVFANGLVGEELTIVWHAGEPLALPVSFYERAFQVVGELPVLKGQINHSMQTNGMLLNDRWCALIKEHRVRLGVSLDGPDFIHDAHRKKRDGSGTHAQVMKGVETLRRHGIDFHAIAVITDEALDYPDEIFNFFLANEIQRVGFNIEEVEGVNRTSTLNGESVEERVRHFFNRMYYRQKSSGGKVKIREFDRAYQAIALGTDADQAYKQNDQVVPFGIISVDCEGRFSTFSPELLGMSDADHGDFFFGDVRTYDILDARKGDKFRRVSAEVEAGVRLCAETCQYFSYCGGGAPANKYYENGSFATAETMFCRYTIKLPLDIVLADLEESLGLG